MKKAPPAQRQIRIIGGQYRGRKLSVPDQDGLRPTPSRVRETLFNWLAVPIVGALVLDVFAGSGALTVEALSRGAKRVLALDNNRIACAVIREHIKRLNCSGQIELHQADALHFLRDKTHNPFDIVLLDPPFNQGLLPRCAKRLEEGDWLAENALIYCESEAPAARLGVPANWQALREKQAGLVHYSLWQRGE
ncbi:16S rRNA (guanine(966)-N(2))-methyltransferase RsmD [Ventosimonas gracilis]|uniref:Ribosomal RNA small subunit methyltransferase D n=1 Tax=Ventosimonas gracilis TaxID=1680762 RepID=A0A139SXF1_9GAMM|nr:16S rRNA (guanine(966)-N(2))-methyltransferase RsmD [Ventosimonas gracilis]KXU39276.1 16S rRNA (guanine(966)-N(2))-methyltransferase RsmD [Ventosimonas gracilis]